MELAESAFQALSADEQKLATAALARMVKYPDDPNLPPTVEALPLKEFPQLQAVVEMLAKASVFSIKGESAYLSDEVLLRSWPRLRDTAPQQLRDDLEQLRWQREKANLLRAFYALAYRRGYARLLDAHPEMLSVSERPFAKRVRRLGFVMDAIFGLYALALLGVFGSWLWFGGKTLFDWLRLLLAHP